MIDEAGLRKPLRELSARDPSVRRVRAASLEVACGSRGLLPRRADPAADHDWTDGLRLELGARPGAGWAALVLDFGCAWTSPQGERLASASGSTPIPPDHEVLVWCQPSDDLANAGPPRAVLAIVRVDPRFGP